MAAEMHRHSSSRRKEKEEEEAKALQRKKVYLWGGVAAAVLILGIGIWASGGLSKRSLATTDPEAKTRLERLFALYKMYSGQKGKGPPNEQTLKDFYNSLPPDQKGHFGDNLDALFMNPRDGEKYEVRYGIRLDPGGPSQGIMWERTGQGGKRYVALSMGYVVLRDEEGFKELKTK